MSSFIPNRFKPGKSGSSSSKSKGKPTISAPMISAPMISAPMTSAPMMPPPPRPEAPPRPGRDRGEQSISTEMYSATEPYAAKDYASSSGSSTVKGKPSKKQQAPSQSTSGKGEGIIPIGLDTGGKGKGKEAQLPPMRGPPPTKGLPATPRPSPVISGHGEASEDVNSVLNLKFSLNGRERAVRDTKGQRLFDAVLGTPSRHLVDMVEWGIFKFELCPDERRDLFTILEWQFACIGCKKYQAANEYGDRPFLFWGDTTPPRTMLRSGPCSTCCREAKERGDYGGIVAYKIVRPSQQ